MNGLGVSVLGLGIAVALSATPATAQSALGPAPDDGSCCVVPAGTVVEVELADPVSTKVQKDGDTFALRLAAPVIVDGQVVLRTGTPGIGVVIQSARPGMGGKAAKLVLAARSLGRGRELAPLDGLQMATGGQDNSNAATAASLTGIAFAPLGLIGLAVQGGEVTLPRGSMATARIADDVSLPPLGPASARAMAAADAVSSAADAAAEVGGAIDVPPPPAGEGQVVFFRPNSLLGTGQWFNVRENGQALGKLTNGAYFIQATTPGLHTYTATEEPEFKDKLKLEVDPGETYFIEGSLTKGVLIGAADLTPSNRAAFDKHSNELKLAAPPTQQPAGEATVGAPNETNSRAGNP
jgi:hypothetical protein